MLLGSYSMSIRWPFPAYAMRERGSPFVDPTRKDKLGEIGINREARSNKIAAQHLHSQPTNITAAKRVL